DKGNLVGIITTSDFLRALEAILGSAGDGSVRIDLDVAGSGEISAAIGLVRTICAVVSLGAYRAAEGEILYILVGAAGAPPAGHALRQYGFRVVAVHQERDLQQTPPIGVVNASSGRRLEPHEFFPLRGIRSRHYKPDREQTIRPARSLRREFPD